ncbi:cytochrome P450 [Streptomyces sp. NPDC002324]
MAGKDQYTSDIDVSSVGFWTKTAAEREESFRKLRDEAPVTWHPPAEGGLLEPEEADGFWAVVRHEDIVKVSGMPETFRSGLGVMFETVPEEMLEATQSFLAMDAPRHTKLRRLVSAAFTPKRVAKIEQQIKNQAEQITDELIETGDCDFVQQVSMRLPMWTICQMMGVPSDQREAIAEAADRMVSFNDDEVRAGREPIEVVVESIMTITQVALEMVAERRKSPQDDLVTSLVQAEVDGERLTDEEISAFINLLAVAGNDTTRNTISHTAKALCDYPGQKAYLLEDFPGRINTAVDEFVRWASPVLTFRRTTVHDTELRGVPIAEGEKVTMFYPSGNRDDRVFSDPRTFDVARTPNKHVGFGGGGPHFCMGNMLAKAQLRAVFGELLHRVPNLEVGEPSYLVSNFVHGVKSMPCKIG